MATYFRQQWLLESADNPADTPGYNKAWLDSVNDHTVLDGSIEDVIATSIRNSSAPLVDLTLDNDEAGPSGGVKDEPTYPPVTVGRMWPPTMMTVDASSTTIEAAAAV
jgi:hypothetical protein